MLSLDLTFIHDGIDGQVSIFCVPNEDPLSVGKPPEAAGFPMCTATIAYPARGYRAVFGWVQLVRSTDNDSKGTAFEMDPLRWFEDSPAPYCWYGILPTLFDAPSRDERAPLDWLAHSFLAVTPRSQSEKLVVPLLGFSWGFNIDAHENITIAPVLRLSDHDWESHLPYLRQVYPNWAFSDNSTIS